MIPFVDLAAQYAQMAHDVEPEIFQILRNCQFTGGFFLERFEKCFANYMGSQFAVGVSNGTDAITLACEALGIGKGDTVIIPNNTFIATAFGISRAGAKPMVVDVDPFTYLIDPDKVEEILKAKKRRIKAIMVVDLYGQMPNMERFHEMARKYRVYLLEDAAQAIGARYNNNPPGYYSDVATTSFYPTKNLGTIGQGGAVITNNAAVAQKVKIIANQGSESKYNHIMMGGNFRLDTLMAAQLYHALIRLDTWNEARRNIAKIYNDAFNSEQRPTQNPSSRHVYHLYEFCCRSTFERERIERALIRNEIGYGFHYPTLISDTPMYHDAEYTPIAEDLKERLISLPMFSTMTEAQAHEVAEVVVGACY